VAQTNLHTEATMQPETQLRYAARKRLSKADRADIASNVRLGVQAALEARQAGLEQNLADWHDMYEMLVEETDWPWVNAANLFVPMIPSELEGLLSYIAGQVLIPHLFMVTGNTEQAEQTAHLVERYYNAEYKRQRGDTTWFEEFKKWLHLGLRDGTAYMEVLWKYEKAQKRVNQRNQRMENDSQGIPAPVLDDEGKPIYDVQEVMVDDVYNDVDLRAVGLRNVLTLPAEAESIEKAVAVIKVEYLYEDQLQKLVRAGVLDEDEVEAALAWVPTGATELAASQQPINTYTAGDQIGIGIGQGSNTSKFFRNRGPIEVYRVHTRQYDLDMDGTPEENIIWVHSTSWRMLGFMRYEYFNGLRPFFPITPFPRPDELLGFSLVERLTGLQNELNAQRNARLNEGNIRLSGAWLVKKGSPAEDEDWAFGPNAKIPYDQDPNEITRMNLGELPQFSFAEENIIKQDARGYTGMSQPAMAQQNSSRRSATEARQQQAATQTRTGLIAMCFRMAIRPVINFVHDLKKQYLTTDQQVTDGQGRFTLPLPVLNQDYAIDITGASDPIDAVSRRTETLGAVDLFMKFPSIQTNPLKQYYLLRKIAHTFGWADVDQIIGTEQEALQQAQAAAQQAAMQGQQPGQPGQPGQHPPQQQQPQRPQPPHPPQQPGRAA
jgi:hypothetical protein